MAKKPTDAADFRAQLEAHGLKPVSGHFGYDLLDKNLPDVIAQAITSKAQAIQNAERAQNELAETQAEAAKKIAEADGDAKSTVARAQGEAEANRIRQASITAQLLELRRLENQRALIDRWNGQLPQVESGSGNGIMLQMPKPQQ